MDIERSIKLLTECVKIASDEYPGMSADYWEALREVKDAIRGKAEKDEVS